MANKSKMKCNVVTKSDRAGKKKMVKACSGGTEKLIHFGASGYGHNYSAAARKSSMRALVQEPINTWSGRISVIAVPGFKAM